jgi:tape measure domain-containing protein
MAKTTKLIGYGISFDMKLVGGVKTADDFARAAKSVQKSINKSTDATKQHKLQLEVLDQALKKSIVTQKQHDEARFSVEAKEIKRQRRLEKERRLVLGLDQQESLLAKNRQQRARMAGMAASGVSGLGMGGRAAGAARFLGGSAGLGAGAASMGVGFAGLNLLKESISAYADLEAKVAGLQTLFGEGLGTTLTNQFRELAKTTILTNNQLIENARTWASYGLTTEGLTDRLKRLGTVAGGNSEKFRSLTIAFAQVNAQGKLMGQEKNQLINAGFSLQAVADAAGISMENFADAMKNGQITAEHLNQALVDVTSEGGLFAGYLEKQAETISGKMTVLSSAWEEFLQNLGKSEKGPAGKFLDKMIYAVEKGTEFAELVSTGEFNLGLGSGTEVSSRFGGAGGVETGFDTTDFTTGVNLLGGMGGGYAEQIFNLIAKTGLFGEDVSSAAELYFKTLKGYADKGFMGESGYASESAAYEAELAAMQEEVARKNKEIAERKALEAAIIDPETTAESFQKLIDSITSKGLLDEVMQGSVTGLKYKDVGEALFGGDDSVNLMETMGEQWDEDRRKAQEKELNRLEREMQALEDQEKMANERHDFEMALLKMQESDLNKRLEQEKKIAAGPAQKDAMFTGGSVEEFMFLRRQTQENETARAVKEAEDRAAEQRRQIEADRKTADQNRDNAIAELKTAINELGTKISNLD